MAGAEDSLAFGGANEPIHPIMGSMAGNGSLSRAPGMNET